MATYPQSLQYTLNRVMGFSKNTVKVLPQTLLTCNPSDTSIFLLPQNAVVHLPSICIKGSIVAVRTGASDQVVFPRYAQSFIDLLDTSVNNTSIDGACPYYGRLNKLINDFTKGDKNNQMSALELGQTFPAGGFANLPNVEYAYASGPYGNSNVAPVAQSDPNVSSSLNALPFYCTGYQGFLGCGKSIDTATCGDVRISVRWAPSTVVAGVGTSPTTTTYQIQNLAMICSVWSVDDGVFYNLLQQRLQTAPISIPFTRWVSITGASFSGSTSIRWSVTTQSLDALYVTFANSGYTSKTYSASSMNFPVPYYTHSANGIGTLQLSVNSTYYPAFPQAIDECFFNTLTALGLNDKAYGQILPSMSVTPYGPEGAPSTGDPEIPGTGLVAYAPLQAYLSYFFLAAFNFGLPNTDNMNVSSVPGIMSGIDSRGLTVNGTVEIVQSSISGAPSINALTPFLFAKTTALLDIGAYRSCALRQ